MLVWIVTGCSVGFGKEICISALARGDKVIATSRGNAQERLADLVAQGADALSLDVTASPQEIEAFARTAIAIYGHIDVLCNNAGYVQLGSFEEASPEEIFKQYQTLVFGPLNITKAFLPHMRERKTGTIVMIGSRGSDMTIPGCGLYTSAKAALAGATQTLSAELAPFNIQITCIQPGDFRTEVFTAPITTTTRIPAYNSVLEPTMKALSPSFKQPGDPHLGAERIVGLVKGEGHAKGRKLPFRIPLGDDAHGTTVDLVAQRGEEVKEWKEWSTGTNFI